MDTADDIAEEMTPTAGRKGMMKAIVVESAVAIFRAWPPSTVGTSRDCNR